MNQSFVERLIYWHFRAAIRASATFGPVRWARLKELLRMAAFDELGAQGYNKSAMAAILDTAQSSITAYSKLSRKPATWPEAPSLTRLILDSLPDTGRLDEWELEDRVYTGRTGKPIKEIEAIIDAPFHYRYELALAFLIREQLVATTHNRDGVTFKITAKGRRHLAREMNEPMIEQASVLEDVIVLCHHLLRVGGPQSIGALLTASRGGQLELDEPRLEAVINYCRSLQEDGAQAPIIIDHSGEEPFLSAHEEAAVTTQDIPTERHVAAVGLVKRVMSFTRWLATEPDPEAIAMKAMGFRVRRGDLLELLQAHREAFLAQAKAAEGRAEGDPDAITYLMTWFGEIIGDPRADSERQG